MIIKYTILATVVALCTTEAKFLRQAEEHRLLRPECDPTPSCVSNVCEPYCGDICTFPNCKEDCPGKYVLNKVEEPFSAHRLHAQQVYGGDLVMVQSEDKMKCLDNMMRSQNNGDNNGYWLGGTGTAGKYSWLNGDSISYQHWVPGQPDCYPYHGNCNRKECMWVWYDGLWDDTICDNKKMGLYEISEQPTIPTPGDDSNPNPSHGQPMDVVFAIDISNSMCRKDLAGLTWLDKTKDAVNEFLDTMDTEASSSSMAGYVGWEYLSFRFKIKVLSEDIHDIKEGVSGLYCHNEGSKSYAAGMNTALRVFDSSTRPDSDPSSKAIIFITDNTRGDTFTPCGGGDVSRGVVIYTVGYETSEEQGDWLARQAACNGGFFRRSDGTSITTAKIFREIFDAINNN